MSISIFKRKIVKFSFFLIFFVTFSDAVECELIWNCPNLHKVINISFFNVVIEVILFTDTELRNIIDKLAQFVARNGPEFEQMTKNKQKGNPKFQFLYGGEYFNYYQYKVAAEQASEYLCMYLLNVCILHFFYSF